ncbi:hypothetical protein BJ165DRAFT_1459718 [Panaeolus papilionaceus]|nr:hypothetical protein BJ165DRAFT_1459718 [Panaeolus papilionaceus]
MLRWCQKTYRILDDSSLISRTRYHVSSVQHATITRAAGQISLLNSSLATEAQYNCDTAKHRLSSNLEHNASFTTASRSFAAKSNSCLVKAPHCTIDPTFSLTSGPPSSTQKLSTLGVSSPKLPNGKSGTLRSLLPWHQQHEQVASVADIVKSYRRLSKQTLLKHLDGNDFSNLIALLGHLNQHTSVDDQYASPYAKLVQQRGKKNLRILFLQEVAKDMQKSGLSMSERDKYWMMQTYLLELAGTHSPDTLPKRLEQARLFYMQLNYPRDIEAQVDFLSYLVQSNQPTLVQEAVDYVCELIAHPVSAPEPLVRLFCSAVLQFGSGFSSVMKEQLLSALNLRLGQRLDDVTPHPESELRAVDISHLTSSLVHTIFHSVSSVRSTFLADWSHIQCRQSFSPSLSLERRWDNLILLAMHCNPTASSPSIPREINDSQCISWRTSFILDALHSHLGNGGLSSEQLAIIKEIARRSWSLFTLADSQLWPLDVSRIFVSAFLRIAATTFSESLRQQCVAYIRRNHLLNSSLGSRRQALHLSSEYLQAYLSCEGQNWGEIGAILSTMCSDRDFEAHLSNMLLGHYIDSDLAIASNFYFFSKKRDIILDPRIVYQLGLRLIEQQQWSSISHILRDSHLAGRVIEQLFTATLRHFQTNRLEHAPAFLVKLLGQQATVLYSQKPVPPSSKYPIRYLFGLMVAAHGTQMVDLIRSVRITTPHLFSPHLLDRLSSRLTRQRQVEQAVELVKLFSNVPSPSISALRSKTVVQAAEQGATRLAKRLASRSSGSVFKSLHLTRALRFGTFPKTSNQLKRVLSVLREVGSTPTTICRGIGMLVKAKKIYLARKLMREKADHLDPKTKTVIGNMILHAPMGRVDLRNGRLVRYVLRTKDLLMEKYGFVPDRATLNIIVKAVLRWQRMVDASQVRRLFDQTVHEGYPVSERWRRKHGVPFGTPPGTNERVALPSLAPHISFAKHTRPLYKLFIKAFYLRHDVSAAKTVVGILKELEVEDIMEREKRNRARREGIIRKRKRETKVPEQSNTSTWQ